MFLIVFVQFPISLVIVQFYFLIFCLPFHLSSDWLAAVLLLANIYIHICCKCHILLFLLKHFSFKEANNKENIILFTPTVTISEVLYSLLRSICPIAVNCPSAWRTFSDVFYRAGLLLMESLMFCIFEKVLRHFWNVFLLECRILSWWSFYHSLNIL